MVGDVWRTASRHSPLSGIGVTPNVSPESTTSLCHEGHMCLNDLLILSCECARWRLHSLKFFFFPLLQINVQFLTPQYIRELICMW